MGPDMEASALRWWEEELSQPQVSFRAALFPALVRVSDPQSLSSELSRDELRVVTQFCLVPGAWKRDNVGIEDLVACFCVNREMVPWFHGEMGRREAEEVLSARERSDGAFLVRFSESHPTKFTLTYLKVHSGSSKTPGRRELKNCLVRNLGAPGYALTEAVRRGEAAGASTRQRTYSSIGAFIQASSNRLKYGVASEFSASCNRELAAVRAMQDQQSNSYSAFSTESFGKPEPPPNAAAMLFSRSPPAHSWDFGASSYSSSIDGRGEATGSAPADSNICSEYGSFASIAVTKPAVSATTSTYSSDVFATGDYGNFASFASQLEDKEHHDDQDVLLGPPPPPPNMPEQRNTDRQRDLSDANSRATDVYGAFASLSSAPSQKDAPVSSPPPPRDSPSPAPNSGVYGSFDSAMESAPIKTTPATSALDELNVGMEFYKQKRLDEALQRFMLAQEMARATSDQVVEARALGNLGTVYLDMQNPHQAVRCYQQCLDITRTIEDTKRERTILNNLVLALVASEEFERALACCQVQLETTTNAINRRKIISRMSLLRERMARSSTFHQEQAHH
ncbi:hypothetical protein PHYBOEH_006327 [Phytophthora boehmeriae]|uniref:SH2 domain-containing protein n=1 Tax=Phytophthora boehmeriae TaxID=109152 RepID=A0A8T1WFM6_9STRA|nr:hypothetical protein PHYBOEH_006327 [Phytophthora boehmeriae]